MNNQLDSLDILAYFSFFMSLVNYDEIVSHGNMQDMVQDNVKDIHEHLKEQDAKIDLILTRLEGGKDER